MSISSHPYLFLLPNLQYLRFVVFESLVDVVLLLGQPHLISHYFLSVLLSLWVIWRLGRWGHVQRRGRRRRSRVLPGKCGVSSASAWPSHRQWAAPSAHGRRSSRQHGTLRRLRRAPLLQGDLLRMFGRQRVVLLLPLGRPWPAHPWRKSRCIWGQYSLRRYPLAGHPDHLRSHSVRRGHSGHKLIAGITVWDLLLLMNLLRCSHGLLRQGLSTRCRIQALRRALLSTHRRGDLTA